ncbi:MAG: DUF4194 domain-containing protein [Francisellaceae bacterium]
MTSETDIDPIQDESESTTDISPLVIHLLKGVLYQENDGKKWQTLLALQSQLRDYIAVLGLELMLDEAEGYAFLRTLETEDNNTMSKPRLMIRRPLSFPVSLLIALLRKKLAEFDASGSDTRLILSREDIVELYSVFLPNSSNEARLSDQIEKYINKVIELGFLYKLKTGGSSRESRFEVKRIIKAYVDAQWLSELDGKLAEYRKYLENKKS